MFKALVLFSSVLSTLTTARDYSFVNPEGIKTLRFGRKFGDNLDGAAERVKDDGYAAINEDVIVAASDVDVERVVVDDLENDSNGITAEDFEDTEFSPNNYHGALSAARARERWIRRMGTRGVGGAAFCPSGGHGRKSRPRRS